MSNPSEPAHSETEVIGGPPKQRPPVPITLDLSQLPSVATAFGVSMVSAAVVVSAMYSRHTDDLDVSVFTVGVLATLVLLGGAAGAHLLIPDSERRAGLVSWPGAFGAVGAALMLGVLIDKEDASTYVFALVIIALSAVGYLVTRSAPFVISGIVGLAALYAKAFDDVIDVGGDGDNTFMIVGAGVLVFVLAITAAGWLLPATRVLSGVIVGVAGLYAMSMILVFLSFARSFGFGFDEGGGDYERHDPYKNDVYVVLLYCVVLAIVWMACSLATGHVAYRLLVLATAVVMIPVATVALVINHPTWWEVVSAALGGLVLLGAAYRSKDRPVVD